MNSARIQIVVGGQFGSEGKGHLTAQLSARARNGALIIRTGGPNAGHTVWAEGVEYKLRHLPTPVAVRPDNAIALAARSVVDPSVLRAELEWFPERTIYVDPMATILEPDHIAHESTNEQMNAIGSTRKGIGAARADRIERVGRVARDLWGPNGTELDPRIICASVAEMAALTLKTGRDVIIEAAQGFGLGLHERYYPYCTSADCTAIDALADSRISPWQHGVTPEVWMAMRPHPIRVAGTSGPLENETSWGELGLPEERTTVTNKVRRVGHWDPELAWDAVMANGGPKHVRIALLMTDQVFPALSEMDNPNEFIRRFAGDDQLKQFLWGVSSDCADAQIAALGTGPRTMLFAADLGRESI